MRPSPRPPLEGLTVVSLEQAVAVPFATRQLADLGARVIKIERPGEGDFARGYDRSVRGQSSYFVWLNRSKQSLTLDLKSDEGLRILHELLGTADVLVQNLGPGAAARLGLDAATVARTHPGVIVCDVSGYGSTGEHSGRKAYDLLIQAETGLLALTGSPDAPARVGVSIADIAAGMYAFTGILTALLSRIRTGDATAVQVSLFDSLAEWLGSPLYYTDHQGAPPARSGAEHATIAPYGPFDTADGAILLAIQNEREWAKFCAIVLGDPALTHDERFAGNSARVAHRAECNALVAVRLSHLTTDEAAALLDLAGVANARMNTVAELLEHPVLIERNRWQEVDTPAGPIRALRPPAILAGTEPVMGPVPEVGAHTTAILTELGYTAGDIENLRSSHTV